MNEDGASLPWLEPVANEDGGAGPSAGKMLAVLALVVASVALVAATLFFVGRNDGGGSGEPPLIEAPETPYKIRPDNPGGMDVASEGDTAFQTSSGEDRDGRLDASKLDAEQKRALDEAKARADAEARRKAAQERGEDVLAPQPEKPTPQPKAEPKPAPPPAGAAGEAIIQIGAYGNQAQADMVWTMLQGRVPELANVSKTTMVATVNGKRYVRLRATGSKTAVATACTALKAAGENCLRIQ